MIITYDWGCNSQYYLLFLKMLSKLPKLNQVFKNKFQNIGCDLCIIIWFRQ